MAYRVSMSRPGAALVACFIVVAVVVGCAGESGIDTSGFDAPVTPLAEATLAPQITSLTVADAEVGFDGDAEVMTTQIGEPCRGATDVARCRADLDDALTVTQVNGAGPWTGRGRHAGLLPLGHPLGC